MQVSEEVKKAASLMGICWIQQIVFDNDRNPVGLDASD